MKKILSLLLCVLMLNLTFPACTFALDDTYNKRVEHIKLSKKLAKKTPINLVELSTEYTKIVPYSTLEVEFAQDFNEKTAQVGDEVVFLLPQGVVTQEGSTILPAGTEIISYISNIVRPKSFNRSGKIYLDFKYIELPNGTREPLQAKIFNDKEALSRGKLNALGKGLGSTLGGMAVGIGAGCGIGVAAGAVIIGGFAIGLPVGFAIGAAAGLMTPGLNYKAKAGDKISIQLTNGISINNEAN